VAVAVHVADHLVPSILLKMVPSILLKMLWRLLQTIGVILLLQLLQRGLLKEAG
jgi:hypothetical protein